jgi:REP element-mobilizing transposase RayT
LDRLPDLFHHHVRRQSKAVLDRDEAAQILVEEWRAAHKRHSWAIGRYVIMPDHVHFFCRPEIGVIADDWPYAGEIETLML